MYEQCILVYIYGIKGFVRARILIQRRNIQYKSYLAIQNSKKSVTILNE